MTQQPPHLSTKQSMPFYIQLWVGLQQFPKTLHKGSQNPPVTSGPAAAFLISAGIGPVVMMMSHHLAETSKGFEATLRTLGSWIPGSVNPSPLWGNIGSYAGKETMLLIGWLLSLAILYPTLKNKHVKPRTLLFWMFILFTLATVMAWHPLFFYLPLQ